MVYVDSYNAPFGRMVMCHLTADTLAELHSMADAIGVKRKWFQFKEGSTPHYDVSLSKRAEAVKRGAVEVDRYKQRTVIHYWRAVLALHALYGTQPQ